MKEIKGTEKKIRQREVKERDREAEEEEEDEERRQKGRILAGPKIQRPIFSCSARNRFRREIYNILIPWYTV